MQKYVNSFTILDSLLQFCRKSTVSILLVAVLTLIQILKMLEI